MRVIVDNRNAARHGLPPLAGRLRGVDYPAAFAERISVRFLFRLTMVRPVCPAKYISAANTTIGTAPIVRQPSGTPDHFRYAKINQIATIARRCHSQGPHAERHGGALPDLRARWIAHANRRRVLNVPLDGRQDAVADQFFLQAAAVGIILRCPSGPRDEFCQYGRSLLWIRFLVHQMDSCRRCRPAISS